MNPTKAQAIQTALMGDWNNAIVINEKLLTDNPEDIDTLNRLAFAQASLGNTKEAKNIYQKVLSIDMHNPIALRNLKRLSTYGSNKVHNGFSTTPRNNLFIEEPGKTKIVELINVADKKMLFPLRSGEMLTLSVKRMKIFVLDTQKQYIGMLPDDLSKRLIEFINGGNEYEAYIRTVDSNKVTIFVRELKRATKYQHQSSFMSTDKTKFLLENSKSTDKQKKSQDLDDDKDDSSEDTEESL